MWWSKASFNVVLCMIVSGAACAANPASSSDRDAKREVDNDTTSQPASAGTTRGVASDSNASQTSTGLAAGKPTAANDSPSGSGAAGVASQRANPGSAPRGMAGDKPSDPAACFNDYIACSLMNPADPFACSDKLAACSASGAGAVGTWNTGAGLATGTAEAATSGTIAILTALGAALKPLGLKFVTDAVSNVLCVVPQIVRCSTFSDYLGCIQNNSGQPENCASAAAACGFSAMDQAALADAAACSAELSRCPGAVETCIAGSAACKQFGALDLASAVGGIATKSTSDILAALVPIIRFEESEVGCQCASEFSQCVDQAKGESEVMACATKADACSTGTPPVTPPPVAPPPVMPPPRPE